MFDAARLVLQSGDRFHVKFTVPADSPVKLCTIPADGSVWLGREEAVSHFLNSEGIKEFYRVEDIELEEPKGVFTSIAVCGMTGEILGPASHHSYQTALHRIHRERFSDMRFEDYKRRVRTENTPEIIEKWKESQKRGQEWVYLTPALEEGAEPLKLKSRAEMESHFRKTHAETLVHETNEAWVAGNIPKRSLSPALFHALRRGVEEARKHLLPVAQLLCSGFEGQGLKLFKRRGGKLWVSRTRPKALDTSTVLSDRIAKLLEIIKAKPGIAVKDLIELVAPSAEAPKAESVAPQTAPAAEVAATDTAENVTAEATAEPAAEAEAEVPPPAAEAAPAPVAAPVQPQPNAEQLHALQDLHWLNSEGYIIEYSDGIVFIGVTEPPPPKPKAAKTPAAAPATAEVKPESSGSDASSEEPVASEAAGAAEEVEVGSTAAVESADESAEVSAQVDAPQDQSAQEATDEPEDEPAAAPFSFLDEAPASGSKE